MVGLYATALALTLAVEVPIVIRLSPRGAGRRAAGVALLANLFTHPLASQAVWSGMLSFWSAEVLVFAAEAAGYACCAGLGWRRAAAVAALANGITLALSPLL